MKNKQNNKATDWEKYYKEQPPQIIIKGRKGNENLLVNLIKDKKIKNAVEFGGANSQIAKRFSDEFNFKEMFIVDNNEYGLKITKKKNINNLRTLCASIFDTKIQNKYDLVYSLGLIEHFSPEGTKKCIEKHVEAAKAGGYVLLTFPTPVLQYRVVRFGLELLGLWRFTDERPLKTKEVITTLEKYGKVEKTTINYKMLCPQGVVLFKKSKKK